MSKKILIITPSWIGDCVMTQPLYRRLHELHPGCTIDAFAPKWSMAVFERMPEINRVMENPFGSDAQAQYSGRPSTATRPYPTCGYRSTKNSAIRRRSPYAA